MPALIDGDKANFPDAEILLNIIAGVDGVPAEAGEVFDDHAVDQPFLYVGEHLLESGTVKIRSGRSVVDIGVINTNIRVLFQKSLDDELLRFNGNGVALLVLHGEADIDRGAAGNGGLRLRDDGFSAFSRHIQPTFLCWRSTARTRAIAL